MYCDSKILKKNEKKKKKKIENIAARLVQF